MKLRIITPKKIVFEEDAISVTVPSSEGEITILPRHTNLFSLLVEGIVKIKRNNRDEQYLAIGGGYLETDGAEVNVLVSRAYGQSQIDEKTTEQAVKRAENLLKEAKTAHEKNQAATLLRRSVIDLKLLRKHRRRPVS